MIVTSPLSDEALEAIEAGCEGVTPGPWHDYNHQSHRDQTQIGAGEVGSDDGWDEWCVAAAFGGLGDERGEANAAHIARLDPATVLSMVHEIRAARTARGAVQPVTGLSDDDLQSLRINSMAPDDIDNPVTRDARIAELTRWFARLSRGKANPKWLSEHAFELAYAAALTPPLTVAGWQRTAFDETVTLAQARCMIGEGSLSLAHLVDMQSRLTPDMSPSKVGRWLGWAQAAVCASGVATLDDFKQLNMRCSAAARTPPASQTP